jgi:type IV secretion system protein VirD4
MPISPLAEGLASLGSKPSYGLKPITHGSASFMEINEAIRLGLNLQGKKAKIVIFLGVLLSEYNRSIYTFIFARRPSFIDNPQNDELSDGNGHALSCAPTRAGKGVSHIIPNVFQWIGSILIIDIKGEIYSHTAGYRDTILNQNVFRFAPFEKESDVWNPIMSIRANLDGNELTREERCREEEDTRYLANLLITPSGSEKDVFWENIAKIFLEGLLLYVRTTPLTLNCEDAEKLEYLHHVRERSMHEVRRLLTLATENLTSLLGDMKESKKTFINQGANALERSLSGQGNMGHSILGMLYEQTAVWSYERLHNVTYKASEDPVDREPAPNDFSFSQMRDGNTSIYLIIPPENLYEYRYVLRVMIGFAVRDLKVSYTTSKNDPGFQDKPPVLFILDEFPQLGYMQPIEDALSYIAGYGVRLWFFIQDLSQLKLHYKNSWQTFMANTEFKIFFGVNDIETANLVSEMIGAATVDDSSCTYGASISTTIGYPSNYSKTWGTNSSNTHTHKARPLVTPDEIMRAAHNKQYIFIRGLKTICCNRLNYYDQKEWLEFSKIPAPKAIDF